MHGRLCEHRHHEGGFTDGHGLMVGRASAAATADMALIRPRQTQAAGLQFIDEVAVSHARIHRILRRMV